MALNPTAIDAQGTTWTFGTTWTRGTTWTFQGTTWTFGTTWTRRRLAPLFLLAAAVLSVVALAIPPGAAAPATLSERVEVIVSGAGAPDAAQRAVHAVGGRVVERLDIIRGVVAEIPARAVDALREAPGVGSVTPNTSVRLFSRTPTAGDIAVETRLDHVRQVIGAGDGVDGSGVGVALLDTGAAVSDALPGLRSVDLGDGIGDGFGHGTHLAGIIGGAADAADRFRGVADGATVVSLRAAAADGSTDLLRVLKALSWVHANRDEVRVLNLSLGVRPTNYRNDLLSVAVEQLWRDGVVVVVAAGNNGDWNGQVTSPAYNPTVIAVGSANTVGTVSTSDDVVSGFSPVGTPRRRVDLVAPGQSIVSLLAPGSVAEREHAATAGVEGGYIKGTGTSQAAAVVTGAVAELLERNPSLSPDQVKAILTRSATRLPLATLESQGAGMLNLGAALAAPVPTDAQQTHKQAGVPDAAPTPPRIAPPPPNEGNGCEVTSIPPAPPAPGTVDPCWTGGTWSGDVFSGGTWSGGTWSGGTWSGGTWSGGTWSGGTWSGGTWSGGTWSGGTWSGGTWSGGTWSGGTWSGGTWSGGTWSGGTWSGGTWSGGTWSGGTWSGGTWSGGTWSGGTWSGGTWSGGTWSGGTWSGGTWSGGTWSGGTWSGGTWSGGTWSGGTWSGGTWSGGTWSGGTWSGGTWSGGTWSGASWTGTSWS